VHVEAGYVPANTDISAFEDALREVAIPIFNRPLGEISIAELLLSMFAVTERFQMETQPQLLLLQKTMVVIEGVARELADQVNIWMLARPLVTEWAARHMGPVGRAEAVAEELKGQLYRWMALPERIELLLSDVEQGKVSVVPEASKSSGMFLGGLLMAAAGATLTWTVLASGVTSGEALGVNYWLVLAAGVVALAGGSLILRR